MKRNETKENITSPAWQKVWKVLKVLVLILRWPVVYYGVLVGGFNGILWIVSSFQEKPLLLTEVIGIYGTLIAGILAAVMLVTSVLTSTFFTETFLVSTGIAAGMYLIASLFIVAPWDWGDSYLEFDAMKMYVFLALTAIILLGDIIALIIRKILKRRSVRHMMKRA